MQQVDSIDIDVLVPYLEQHVPGFAGPAAAEKFPGGQSNPTFKINAASGQYVLRRQPPGKLLKSAHAVDREYRVLNALKDSAVPVAKVFHLCEDTEIIGSMFYLMEYLPGRVFWDSALPEIADNAARARIHFQVVEVLATLHSVNPADVGLEDYGRPGNYYQRQIERWVTQYRASEMGTIDVMEELIVWLSAHVPADDGSLSIAHGDFRLDNLMFHPDREEIIAVLDWELSTLGHPLADLAYHCMQLRMPSEGLAMKGLAGIDTAALGIPSEKELVTRYCEIRGIGPIANWEFYLAFSFFRLAAIAQGVAKRASQGNASSKQAQTAGAFVQPLAASGMQIIQDGA
ncbi:phosphotransferase family protein [Zhongshania sp.]|uniref:phosphotransferase family protein n=1 Tax=Zhongshania sp. TaxID=1971902 RepID=UPI003567E37F